MDLHQFDQNFTPVVPGRTPGLDALRDGDYLLKVAKAELATTPKLGESIVRWLYTVVEGPSMTGGTVEHVTFLRTQEQANALGADLLQMGVPTTSWVAANGKAFSTELPGALSFLKGVTIQVAKTSKQGVGDRVYHNLRIRSVQGTLGGSAMPTSDPLPF